MPSRCRVRVIFGQDFGITRKEAVEELQKWGASTAESDWLRVAEHAHLRTFHPKILLWKEQRGGRASFHVVLGSSNVTQAAFGLNVEANVRMFLTGDQYDQLVSWADDLFDFSTPVDESWFKRYVEAPSGYGSRWPPARSRSPPVTACLP